MINVPIDIMKVSESQIDLITFKNVLPINSQGVNIKS